ncbi:MAG: hypothetical protein H6726_20270 [Sandaracinaceae bacterium]|nr:hypothetical protein [Sandaracinaceae bacterium]
MGESAVPIAPTIVLTAASNAAQRCSRLVRGGVARRLGASCPTSGESSEERASSA